MIIDWIQENAAWITLGALIGGALVGAWLFDPFDDDTWGNRH